MQENEVKFYVLDLARIERALQAQGARLIQPRTHEVNLRFDTPSGVLQRAGRVLRLRRGAAVLLTYKSGSRLNNGMLTRREIEFAVSDFETARQFLEALGYQAIFMYEKYRTTFDLDDTHVMLDEMPYGSFVEIEGEAEALPAIASRLGLNWKAAIPVSYQALFERLQAVLSLPDRDLSFDNLAGAEVRPHHLGVQAADV